MKYDRLWERLIEYVDEWASAREVPGGIEVTFEHPPGATRTVEVMVTPADWDGYISTIFGTGDPRATPLREKVLATPPDVRFLIYDSGTCDWEPSPTRELPPEDEVDHGPGEWVVMDDEGNVIDRLRDFLERAKETGPGR